MKPICFYRNIYYFFVIIALTMAYGCNKSDLESDTVDDVKFEPLLVTSTLSVAIPKGWTESVEISSLDSEAIMEDFSASSANTNIATVSKSGDKIIISGVDHGKTIVTVVSNSGVTRQIPVNVYNPRVMETDELLISYSNEYELRYRRDALSFWHPKTTDGFLPLGSICINHFAIGPENDPNGLRGVMVVKAKPGSEDALAPPVSFSEVFYMRHWSVTPFGTVWMPNAPPGYVALGMVVTTGRTQPKPEDVVTVREDLTIPGSIGKKIISITDRDRQFFPNIRPYVAWEIIPPVTGPHENAFLPPGTFVYRSGPAGSSEPSAPSAHAAMHVLNVKLPMLTEPVSHEQYVPRLTSYDPPPDVSFPITSRELLVPSTILSDPNYASDPNLAAVHTPFYRLERQVFYRKVAHWHNTTNQTVSHDRLITFGISQTLTEEIWGATKIELSYSAGVSIKMFEAGYTATVSRSLGYSSSVAISEFQEETIITNLIVGPYKAGAIFQRYSLFVLKRHNENTQSMEIVRAWEVGGQDYVTADYPPE